MFVRFLILLSALLFTSVTRGAEAPESVSPSAEAAPAAPAPAPAPTYLWADKVKLSGFMKVWLLAAENAKKEYRPGSAMVKNLRLRVDAQMFEGNKVVVIPEFAGQTPYAVTLLDAFVQITRGPLDITAGQFLLPFSQDITTNPAKLWSVDNDIIDPLVKPGKSRDQGLMLGLSFGPLMVQAAAVQGLGINQASASGYMTDRNDYVGRAELKVPGTSLVVGGGIYSGYAGLAEPINWTEAHLRCESSPLAPPVFWKAEWINRPDSGRWGLAANLGVKTGAYRTVAVYERVEDPLHALGQTRWGGGVTRAMGGGLSVSLMQLGDASGPSASPTSTRSILQLLAEF